MWIVDPGDFLRSDVPEWGYAIVIEKHPKALLFGVECLLWPTPMIVPHRLRLPPSDQVALAEHEAEVWGRYIDIAHAVTANGALRNARSPLRSCELACA